MEMQRTYRRNYTWGSYAVTLRWNGSDGFRIEPTALSHLHFAEDFRPENAQRILRSALGVSSLKVISVEREEMGR